jgi:hypothetical protein
MEHHLAQVQLGKESRHRIGISPGKYSHRCQHAACIRRSGKEDFTPASVTDMCAKGCGSLFCHSLQYGFAVGHKNISLVLRHRPAYQARG